MKFESTRSVKFYRVELIKDVVLKADVQEGYDEDSSAKELWFS